jgi:hypothetical protein
MLGSEGLTCLHVHTDIYTHAGKRKQKVPKLAQIQNKLLRNRNIVDSQSRLENTTSLAPGRANKPVRTSTHISREAANEVDELEHGALRRVAAVCLHDLPVVHYHLLHLFTVGPLALGRLCHNVCKEPAARPQRLVMPVPKPTHTQSTQPLGFSSLHYACSTRHPKATSTQPILVSVYPFPFQHTMRMLAVYVQVCIYVLYITLECRAIACFSPHFDAQKRITFPTWSCETRSASAAAPLPRTMYVDGHGTTSLRPCMLANILTKSCAPSLASGCLPWRAKPASQDTAHARTHARTHAHTHTGRCTAHPPVFSDVLMVMA